MKTATYNGLEMTIQSAGSYGRYIISDEFGHKVETTDAEIYDYFDCDYYDKGDEDWARRVAYNKLQG